MGMDLIMKAAWKPALWTQVPGHPLSAEEAAYVAKLPRVIYNTPTPQTLMGDVPEEFVLCAAGSMFYVKREGFDYCRYALNVTGVIA